MRKIFILLSLLLSVTIFASDVKWAKDYENGLALAKKTNKPVMFVHSRHSCKWCVFLDEKTFRDKEITKELNENFVSVTSYSDEYDYTPKELYTPTTPTIWFLLPSGQPMFQPIMGAMKAKDFKNALAIVKSEYEKIKEKK